MLSSNIIDKNRAIYLTTDDPIKDIDYYKRKYKILMGILKPRLASK